MIINNGIKTPLLNCFKFLAFQAPFFLFFRLTKLTLRLHETTCNSCETSVYSEQQGKDHLLIPFPNLNVQFIILFASHIILGAPTFVIMHS